jgi:predicted helicase
MPHLNLKTSHKPIRDYYTELHKTTQQTSLLHEGAVAPHFANLLRACANKVDWTLGEQAQIPRKGQHPIRADGVLLDRFNLRRGVWEAKDSNDDLDQEIKKKFAAGYPQDNILFQEPNRAVLYQDGRLVADEAITNPERLVEILKQFFAYQPPAYDQWEQAVAEFKERVPELAQALLALIEVERTRNKPFATAFANFNQLVREAINPNIADQAVEEMLIQHLLTERIFRKVFNNAEFARRNVIAREIENVIDALTSRHFSREQFLGNLDRFYGAIEQTAATIEEYSEKQAFLNTVYENFFQGFSVKVADTHGIVYTPQPIVDFMVRSVDDILRREFGKADGLASSSVAILDPFVGTGNFILRVMRQMPKSKLPHKYTQELFCNEVMLLPYYIASMNIEHEYFQLTGKYAPFTGISLVDTFDLAEGRQIPLFAPENSQRVQRQRDAEIFVIIGNPPYNAGQVNANDNNKNRVYQTLDEQVYQTYSKDSRASDKTDLNDPYVKAFKWASSRIGQEGVVAFVTNGGYLDGRAFDGMRQHLLQDFNAVYVLDLGGNVRRNPKLSGTTHNVFGIQVGVCITFLVKVANKAAANRIYYYRTDEFWTKQEKFDFLDSRAEWSGINWTELQVNDRNAWLTQGIKDSFNEFLPMGTKRAKKGEETALFANYGLGVATSRDAWVYNFSEQVLEENIIRLIATYSEHLSRWQRLARKPPIDNFVEYKDTKISWSDSLKKFLVRGIQLEFAGENVRFALRRPFCRTKLYFDPYLNARRYQLPYFLPNAASEAENLLIAVNQSAERPFTAVMTNLLPDLVMTGGYGSPAQCFPFYTYDEDGTNRRENITDWALAQFREQYQQYQAELSKWDIFYYVYALLHHPTYRETFAANLRQDLPHIPFVPAEHFGAFVQAGRRLAEIHVQYEDQPEYPLQHIENADLPLDWRVERMRLSKDKTELVYNEFLTLAGIPPEVFAYKLGNRSALEWVVDQYQVSTDKRSGITNDPNNLEDETYIVRLIKQVVTVSLETVGIVNGLPPLAVEDLV